MRQVHGRWLEPDGLQHVVQRRDQQTPTPRVVIGTSAALGRLSQRVGGDGAHAGGDETPLPPDGARVHAAATTWRMIRRRSGRSSRSLT